MKDRVKRIPSRKREEALHVASLTLEPEPTSSAAQLSSGLGHLSLGLQKKTHLGKRYCVSFNPRKTETKSILFY